MSRYRTSAAAARVAAQAAASGRARVSAALVVSLPFESRHRIFKKPPHSQTRGSFTGAGEQGWLALLRNTRWPAWRS